MAMKALLVSAVVALIPGSPGSAEVLPGDRFQAIVDEAIASGVPGVVLRIETADSDSWTGVGGPDIGPDSHFHLFSITKTIAAATAFTLIDEGKLGLDDPIDAWLDPDLIADLPNIHDVTVRQLIAQTSGIRDYQDDRFIAMIREDFERVWTPAELVAHAADGVAAAPPGNSPSYYSNTNYALLGLVIEKASGMALANAIRTRVLEPLGANATFSWGETGRPDPVPGYFDDAGTRIDVSAIDLSIFWGSGDLVSTAADTSKLLRGILAGELLAADSRGLMTGDFRPLVGRPVEYGYGTFRVPQWDPAPIGHSGEGPGGDAMAIWWPSDGMSVVILTNLDNGAHVVMLEKVAEALGR